MLYYINLFYFYSFVGFLLELFIKTFIFKSMNSGIMYGPWLPVYGFGGVIIVLMEKYIFKKRNVSKWLKVVLVFFILMICLSIIEYLGGILIENIFHKVFWDYSDMKYNIGKYTSVEMGLVWGIGSLVIIYIIQPFCEIFIKKIPLLITIIVSCLFLGDFIFTFFC